MFVNRPELSGGFVPLEGIFEGGPPGYDRSEPHASEAVNIVSRLPDD
jgi:hypothetical protein